MILQLQLYPTDPTETIGGFPLDEEEGLVFSKENMSDS